MKLKKAIYKSVFVCFVISALFWVFSYFALPEILNSDYMVGKYEALIENKTGFPVQIMDFDFKTNLNLSFVVKVGKISSKNDEINLENIKYESRVLSLTPKKVDAKMVYLDLENAKSVFPEKKENKNIDINSVHFPVLNIEDAYIKLDDKTSMKIRGAHSEKLKSKIVCRFVAEIISPYFDSPVFIGESGGISYKRNIIFDNLKIKNKTSEFYLNDEISKLHITASNLSAAEVEKTFLYFYKYKHNGRRNFIENFTNFKGTLDVDIIYDKAKDGFFGNCIAKNLGADFSKYNIPVYLPYVVFDFSERKMSAKTKGTFGSEPAYTDVVIENIGTKDLHTVGHVKSTLTNSFAQKYFKPVTITGGADASVKYDVKNSIVNIDYRLALKKGSNLLTQYGNFDITKRYRLMHAHTTKNGNVITLDKYTYSISDNGKDYFELLRGDGSFENSSGHYQPVVATVRTNGNISIRAVRSFIDNYLDAGRFNADLKYVFKTKSLTGVFNLYDVRRNDFLYLEKVGAKATDNNVIVEAQGTFFDSPISFSLNADNNFEHGFVVNNADIHLKSFRVVRGHLQSVKNEIDTKRAKYTALKPHKPTSDYPIEIKNGKIVVDEITHSKFRLHDVVLSGNFKDKIVNFILWDTEYAKGILGASGKYNVETHSSDINFLASEIDSNEVVTNLFNLPGQLEGSAYATLHLITKNKLNDIKANATFAIEDGFLPKLGSREFVLNSPNKFKKALFFAKKPIKFTLSKICNIDFSKPNVFYSNLRGSFVLDNDIINNVRIYSESDNLSMLIEGNYNIESEVGNLVIWGKRDKVSDKTIKIFKIPLGIIYKAVFRVEKSMDTYEDKVKQIPPINAPEYETSVFRVNADGNLNSNDIKLQFKDIRSGNKK